MQWKYKCAVCVEDDRHDLYQRERRGGTQRESAAREVHNNSSIRIAVHEAHTRESYFIIITKRSQEDYD